jgi:hypothetical protein
LSVKLPPAIRLETVMETAWPETLRPLTEPPAKGGTRTKPAMLEGGDFLGALQPAGMMTTTMPLSMGVLPAV